MHILILGATGLVGSALVAHASQDDTITQITCLSRRPFTHSHPKVTTVVIDFEHPESWPKITGDALLSCFGTTLKQAGSKAAMTRVDVDYQYQVASWGKANGIEKYILVSAIGAKSTSRIFYSRIRGVLEEKVIAIGFSTTFILQPSLLLGKRLALRCGELIASALTPKAIMNALPGLRNYAPIRGEDVAKAMMIAAKSHQKGCVILGGTHRIQEFIAKSTLEKPNA